MTNEQIMLYTAALQQAALKHSRLPSKTGANSAVHLPVEKAYSRGKDTKKARSHINQDPMELANPGTIMLSITKTFEQANEGDPRRKITFPFRPVEMNDDLEGIQIAKAHCKFWSFYDRQRFFADLTRRFYLGHPCLSDQVGGLLPEDM